MRRHAMEEWTDTDDEEGAAKAFDAMDERIRPPIGAHPRRITPSRTTLDACQRAGCPIEAGAIHAWLCTWSVRRIWQQVDTVTAREAERLRAQVRKLIGLLNADRPALDENGYPMWDHLIALSNRQCWQWEIAAAHSGCLAAIMQAAGIDDWPPADSMPDITNPVITINLSTNQ